MEWAKLLECFTDGVNEFFYKKIWKFGVMN